MRLTELPGIDITGLTANSSDVKPGFLFAALPGVKKHGREFISAAIQAGAAAILVADHNDLPIEYRDFPHITDLRPRHRLANIAARFYPKQPEHNIAVTGTNGKTSTVNFARQIWANLGYNAASIGTLGIISHNKHQDLGMTTPDPVSLHRCLDELTREGTTHLAIEASSHGLEQGRLSGLKLTAAAFTNLTRDHLDYHGTMAAYLHAKSLLFSELLPEGKTAVINADIPEYQILRQICASSGQRIISFGHHGQDLQLLKRSPLPVGQVVELSIMGRQAQITLPLVGAFQVMNLLCATGLVMACGDDPFAITGLLEKIQGVRGRLEQVGCHPNGAAIYVDYAHTPDALENILHSLRPHTHNRLIVVFGCGGDRDSGKRPEMGKIATQLADVVIVTDDNPRTEQAATIRQQVMVGCPEATEIGDRAEAIAYAIQHLQPGDLLVVAGKGHEQGQIIGTTIRPFDDADVVRGVLKDL